MDGRQQKAATPRQQMPRSLHNLTQRHRDLVARNSLFGLRVEAPATHGAIRRIAHHGSEACGRKTCSGSADIALYDADLPGQSVVRHVPLRHGRQAGLQFQRNDGNPRKAPRQQKGDNAAAGAEVDDGSGGFARDKIGEQEGVEREAVTVRVLVQGETPGPRGIRRLVSQPLSLAAR